MAGLSLTPTQALVSRLTAGGFAPLLPQQRAVKSLVWACFSDRLERALDAVATRRTNGAAIEALHHRRYPRSDNCFWQPRDIS